MDTNFDPYDVKAGVKATTIEDLEADELYLLAIEAATEVQDLHHFVLERPRYAALFDQAQRSSSSIALNMAQGYFKLKGFLQNDLLVARAEAAETYAALCLLPKEMTDAIKEKIKKILRLLDERLLALPEKSDRPYWKN